MPRTIGSGLLDRLFHSATVSRLDWATPRMRAITLRTTGQLSWTPGQEIRVAVVDPLSRAAITGAFRDVLRTYSVWALDGSDLELRVFDHGDGPGARWARNLSVGNDVLFRGPEGDFVLDPVGGRALFVGEETACVAFGPLVRAYGAEAMVVAEVESEDDQLPLPGKVTWGYRHGRSAASAQSLVEMLRPMEIPHGRAYLAGEARTIQLVRTHLVNDRGWSRRDIRTKPFWTPGKRGLE